MHALHAKGYGNVYFCRKDNTLTVNGNKKRKSRYLNNEEYSDGFCMISPCLRGAPLQVSQAAILRNSGTKGFKFPAFENDIS